MDAELAIAASNYYTKAYRIHTVPKGMHPTLQAHAEYGRDSVIDSLLSPYGGDGFH